MRARFEHSQCYRGCSLESRRRIIGQDIQTSECAIVTKRLKRLRDTIQRAKPLGDIAIGQVKNEEEMTWKAQAGRAGGLRAAKLALEK
jgi:hypothetical protein